MYEWIHWMNTLYFIVADHPMPATPACHGIERAINQHSFSVRGFPSQWLLPLLPCSRARNKNNPETCSVLLRLLHGFHAAGNALPTAHPQQSLTFLRTCDFFFFPPVGFPSLPLPSPRSPPPPLRHVNVELLLPGKPGKQLCHTAKGCRAVEGALYVVLNVSDDSGRVVLSR